MKLIKAKYSVSRCTLYFQVIKVQYQNDVLIKVKGAFVTKAGSVFEMKNYNLIKSQITHWQLVSGV